jgi:hypothetical protein
MYIDRETFAQEMKLRQLIRESIKIVNSRKEKERLEEEKKLRDTIQKILTEVSASPEDSPHKSKDPHMYLTYLKPWRMR